MSWGNPWVLPALLLPALALWWMRRARQTVAQRWPAMRRVLIAPGDHVLAATPRQTPRGYLLIAAIALALIALARPQWGRHAEVSFSQSVEVMIALDLSRSMWALDMPARTSRLQAAKTVLGNLLDGFKGENVGLILFAGTAFVQVPMGPDDQIIREFLPDLDPRYMPRGGSDYNRLLDAALEGFGTADDRDRYLIVLSDGESTTQGWEQKVPELVRRGIHVIGIGVGTEQGAVIPDHKGGRVLDAAGAVVISRLTPATLRSLADRTGGAYVRATDLDSPAAVRTLIRNTVETGRAGRSEIINANVANDRFQWFLAPAVLLALLALMRELPRDARPRRVRAAPAIALVLFACAAAGPRTDAASDGPDPLQQAARSDPAQRLRALAGRLGETGYSAADLDLFVILSIQYGGAVRNHNRLPQQGVIRDALDAVHAGRRLAPALAPWDHYETQLRDLMVPLPGSFREQDTGQSDGGADGHKNDSALAAAHAKGKAGSDEVKRDGTAVTRSDFTLGDLSADDNFAPRQSRKDAPKAPKPAGPAAHPANAPPDPALAEARREMIAVVKADSPGRVHQLLEGDDKARSPGPDW